MTTTEGQTTTEAKGARLGPKQWAMLRWLARHGGNGEIVYVGHSTPGTDEIAGWDLEQAKRVLRSLRKRRLVNCPRDGKGAVRLTEEGIAITATGAKTP